MQPLSFWPVYDVLLYWKCWFLYHIGLFAHFEHFPPKKSLKVCEFLFWESCYTCGVPGQKLLINLLLCYIVTKYWILSFCQLVFFQLALVLYFFLELIYHSPHYSELMYLNLFEVNKLKLFINCCGWAQINEACFNQFQKGIQNLCWFERKQVYKKKCNPIFGDNIA